MSNAQPGRRTRFIKCASCEREQAIVGAGEPGGITEDEALLIGWRRYRTVAGTTYFLCPFSGGKAN